MDGQVARGAQADKVAQELVATETGIRHVMNVQLLGVPTRCTETSLIGPESRADHLPLGRVDERLIADLPALNSSDTAIKG